MMIGWLVVVLADAVFLMTIYYYIRTYLYIYKYKIIYIKWTSRMIARIYTGPITP